MQFESPRAHTMLLSPYKLALSTIWHQNYLSQSEWERCCLFGVQNWNDFYSSSLDNKTCVLSISDAHRAAVTPSLLVAFPRLKTYPTTIAELIHARISQITAEIEQMNFRQTAWSKIFFLRWNAFLFADNVFSSSLILTVQQTHQRAARLQQLTHWWSSSSVSAE